MDPDALQSTGSRSLGWMAMYVPIFHQAASSRALTLIGRGFGTLMSNSAMVILWPNPDGNITISQRQAPTEVMPTLDNNPPRIATLSTDMSNVRTTDACNNLT